jgi:hypothetical protein
MSKRIDVLNRHLTIKGATSIDGNDRVTRAYRNHTVAGPAKDISARVDRAAGVEVGVGEVGGYSGLVSRGTRPVHKADKRSFKRV